MVKSWYFGNEDLDLVRDRIKVRQMNPFITNPGAPLFTLLKRKVS